MEMMETIITLAGLLVVGYGLLRGLKWMMQAGSVQAGKNPPLSPNDLKVLEESAERFMADLRRVTDECVERIERALARTNGVLGHNDAPLPSLDAVETPLIVDRDSRMLTGEAELLEGLRAIGKT